MSSNNDLVGIIGSQPKKFGLVARKHFDAVTNRGRLDGGFESFYEKQKKINQIGEHRKKKISPPPSREYQYRPLQKVFPNRKPPVDKAQGLRKTPAPESKEFKMTRRRKIEIKNAGIFKDEKVHVKGRKKLEGPKSYAQSIEDEIQKKKRLKVPGENGDKKVNLYAAQDNNYIFRVYQDEVVSPFDSRITRQDRRIIKERNKKMKGKDKDRERRDEESAVSSLSWGNTETDKEND